MDDFDDWQFRRDFHAEMGGSISLAFSKQQLFYIRENFESAIAGLERLGQHAQNRPVQLRIQFEAYFLALYACLEFITISVCDDLAETLRLPIAYNHLRGNTAFDKAWAYFKLVESQRTLNATTVQSFGRYHIVRNAIAHGVGVSNLVGERRKLISQLSGLISDPEDDSIGISLAFCTAFYDFADGYLDELEGIFKDYGDRLKFKAKSVT